MLSVDSREAAQALLVLTAWLSEAALGWDS